MVEIKCSLSVGDNNELYCQFCGWDILVIDNNETYCQPCNKLKQAWEMIRVVHVRVTKLF